MYTPKQRYVLKTPTLRAREFVNSDKDTLIAMHGDRRMRELLLDDFPCEEDAVAQRLIDTLHHIYRLHEGLGTWHLERWVSRRELDADHRPSDDSPMRDAAAAEGEWRFCGWCNLTPLPDRPDCVEFGGRVPPDSWGSGVTMEAGTAVLDHAFLRLGLPRVFGYCHPRNRSAKLGLLSLGFEADGEQAYGTGVASAFVVVPQQWNAVRLQPRRLRMRAAMQQLRSLNPELLSPPSCAAVVAVDQEAVCSA
jgi:RimJ/RimL family protein N-acetyltransferase